MPAPAHSSHDSDSERPTEGASRKHSIYTRFPKDLNCEVCLHTKMTRPPCVPEHRDFHASSFRGSSLEPTPARSADLGKHSVHTHFPKDRNCEICKRTKITRAPCRRRTGEAVLRAKKLGGLMTADHKVLNEEGESRNNHRYAVVVQDLATQWIQSYPCKSGTSRETEGSLRKFLEPSEKSKVIF